MAIAHCEQEHSGVSEAGGMALNLRGKNLRAKLGPFLKSEQLGSSSVFSKETIAGLMLISVWVLFTRPARRMRESPGCSW